jgi:hypothetical protein
VRAQQLAQCSLPQCAHTWPAHACCTVCPGYWFLCGQVARGMLLLQHMLLVCASHLLPRCMLCLLLCPPLSRFCHSSINAECTANSELFQSFKQLGEHTSTAYTCSSGSG